MTTGPKTKVPNRVSLFLALNLLAERREFHLDALQIRDLRSDHGAQQVQLLLIILNQVRRVFEVFCEDDTLLRSIRCIGRRLLQVLLHTNEEFLWKGGQRSRAKLCQDTAYLSVDQTDRWCECVDR